MTVGSFFNKRCAKVSACFRSSSFGLPLFIPPVILKQSVSVKGGAVKFSDDGVALGFKFFLKRLVKFGCGSSRSSAG